MRIMLPDGDTLEVEGIENVNLDEEEFYFEGERLTEVRAEQIAHEISRRHIPDITDDPFFSETNLERLRKAIADVESGKSCLTEHELIEVADGNS